MTSLKSIFLEESKLKDHLDAQNNSYNEYLANYFLLTKKYNTKLSIIKRAQILSSAIQRNDKEFAKYLFTDTQNYNLPVVIKTCAILDSRRYANRLSKKLEKITNKKKLAKYKSILENVKKLNGGADVSLTKSKCRFIKNSWINNLSKKELEYNIIQFPANSWKKIIDLLHLKPNDFKLEWFTKYVYEGVSPENSMVSECLHINNDNIVDIIKKYKLPYGFIKSKYSNLLTDEVKEILTSYMPLNEIIANWNLFNSPSIYEKTATRLKEEKLAMPYGELMKRLQSFHTNKNIDENMMNKLVNVASIELNNYNIKIEQPVVVFGDASASMDVAIRTSSIIMSILCSICNAKMHLFRKQDEFIENPPRNVDDVIDIGTKCKARGSTSPAASFYPYLEKKEVVKTFILVTDEEENTSYDGSWKRPIDDGCFADLFKQYREKVYPAKLVFISFLPNNKDGEMVKALKEKIPGIEKSIILFRLNNKKPDLRKLDSLLDMLTMETGLYDFECNNLISKIRGIPINDKFELSIQFANGRIDEIYEPDNLLVCI